MLFLGGFLNALTLHSALKPILIIKTLIFDHSQILDFLLFMLSSKL